MISLTPNFLVLKKLWGHLSSFRRKQLFGLGLLITISSFAEMVSIGAVIPFIAVLTQPTYILNNPVVSFFIPSLGYYEATQLIFPLTLVFIFAVIFSGILKILTVYLIPKISFAIGADLSLKMYSKVLNQPYQEHIERNSSDVINGVIKKSDDVIYKTIMPILSLASSVVIIISILLALIIINAEIALITFGSLGLIYFLIVQITKRRLSRNGLIISRESGAVIKAVQEGLGSIRDVIIDGSQNYYYKLYEKSDKNLRSAQSINQFISLCPRYLVEALALIVIALIAYQITIESKGEFIALPILGALALGAQRMLPQMQQIYSSWSYMQMGMSSLNDVIELLDQRSEFDKNHIEDSTRLTYAHQIKLDNLSFKYKSKLSNVLSGINLEIKKGSKVGFIGRTGSGKSTLLDLIMGLMTPTQGTIKIDGMELKESNRKIWFKHIAHVPQSIFLIDATIAENIALGVSYHDIDWKKIKLVSEKAQLSKVVERLPNQYNEIVGERGVRLSGGQRQRIGIARALYKNADLIVFDEATSALDGETEKEVMRAIYAIKDVTLLIIAHRMTTLSECDRIINLDEIHNAT